MAAFVMEGLDDLIREIEKMGYDLDDTALQMVEEGAEIMDQTLKDAIQTETTEYGTGTLAASINHTKPTRNAWGYFSASTARGVDSRNGKYRKARKTTPKYTRTAWNGNVVRNHDKLYYLEFGNSRQAAHPIVQKCVNRAEPKVLEKMQQVYERRMGQ